MEDPYLVRVTQSPVSHSVSQPLTVDPYLVRVSQLTVTQSVSHQSVSHSHSLTQLTQSPSQSVSQWRSHSVTHTHQSVTHSVTSQSHSLTQSLTAQSLTQSPVSQSVSHSVTNQLGCLNWRQARRPQGRTPSATATPTGGGSHSPAGVRAGGREVSVRQIQITHPRVKMVCKGVRPAMYPPPPGLARGAERRVSLGSPQRLPRA